MLYQIKNWYSFFPRKINTQEKRKKEKNKKKKKKKKKKTKKRKHAHLPEIFSAFLSCICKDFRQATDMLS